MDFLNIGKQLEKKFCLVLNLSFLHLFISCFGQIKLKNLMILNSKDLKYKNDSVNKKHTKNCVNQNFIDLGGEGPAH